MQFLAGIDVAREFEQEIQMNILHNQNYIQMKEKDANELTNLLLKSKRE